VKRGKVRFGEVWVDALTFGEALDAIVELVAGRRGGAVYTPNVDHVVVASRVPEFRDAYSRADLVLCDGQPLLWTSGLVGLRLPAKVSGSDLFLPLLRRAAREKLRVYLLGCGPGVAEEASERLRREEGVEVVSHSAPRIGLAALPDEDQVIEAVAATRPDLVLVGLGTPKGELFIARARDRLRPAVALSIGASVDFYVGRVRRAPRWMQRLGLEWLFRLLQEPRRLARRYLVEDPRFLAILLHTLRRPRAERVLQAPRGEDHPPAR
jgi:N-acetylglucosaminyldiphosphoundecaprenol N-acetyl-beta-D-mannosaminyltransferase